VTSREWKLQPTPKCPSFSIMVMIVEPEPIVCFWLRVALTLSRTLHDDLTKRSHSPLSLEPWTKKMTHNEREGCWWSRIVLWAYPLSTPRSSCHPTWIWVLKVERA
jgi:hypothetical protein